MKYWEGFIFGIVCALCLCVVVVVVNWRIDQDQQHEREVRYCADMREGSIPVMRYPDNKVVCVKEDRGD